jgi:polar amino acid transport system substrate-binding protein
MVTGVVERVLTEAYQRLGIELTVERLPAKRALRMAADGESDGELVRVAGLEFEHDGLILVPVQVGIVEGVVFTTADPFPVEGWRSLLPYRVGIQRGIRILEKGQYSMEVFLVSSTTQLFKLLVAGRLDAIVVLTLEGLTVGGYPGVRQLDPPLFSHDLYHYLHWKNRDLVPAITEVLRCMRSEGRLQQIRMDLINELSVSKTASP